MFRKFLKVFNKCLDCKILLGKNILEKEWVNNENYLNVWSVLVDF